VKPAIQRLGTLGLTLTIFAGVNSVVRPAETGEKTAAVEPKPAAHEAKEESRVSRGPNGEAVVTLDEATQQRIGLKVASLTATNFPPSVKGYGRVLDPAPLIQLVAELAPAGILANASRKEFERLKTLRARDNASDRALEAAEAQMLRDQVLAESLRLKLALGWGQTIAASDQLPELARALATMQAALVRLDLPAAERLPGKPTGVQLLPFAAETMPIAAEFLGAATSTEPQFQGQGFLFLLRGRALPANAAVIGLIQTDGPPVQGVLLPADAILRHEGKRWAYVQTGADLFARREVPLARAVSEGYLVTSGFTVGDKVVTTGAQLLLSEELKGQGGEE
jgi:multidrug efflux system membrane fusion protein